MPRIMASPRVAQPIGLMLDFHALLALMAAPRVRIQRSVRCPSLKTDLCLYPKACVAIWPSFAQSQGPASNGNEQDQRETTQ